jgi:hypothetical protein
MPVPTTLSTKAEYIRVLISKGAKVNAKTDGGLTPLRLLKAISEIIKLLKAAGAKE